METRQTAGGAAFKNDQYGWSLRYLDAPIFRQSTDFPGGVATAGDRLYYLTDPKMNVTCLVDHTGAAVERYLYDPSGQPLFFDGNYNSRTSSAYHNDVLYSGYRRDPVTGMYHVRFRDLHPRLGRWLNTDPSGYSDGANLYGYAAGDPATLVDPFGLAVREPTIFEGLIPVYGSGLQSAHHFSCGEWGWGLFYGTLALGEAFGFGNLAKIGRLRGFASGITRLSFFKGSRAARLAYLRTFRSTAFKTAAGRLGYSTAELNALRKSVLNYSKSGRIGLELNLLLGGFATTDRITIGVGRLWVGGNPLLSATTHELTHLLQEVRYGALTLEEAGLLVRKQVRVFEWEAAAAGKIATGGTPGRFEEFYGWRASLRFPK